MTDAEMLAAMRSDIKELKATLQTVAYQQLTYDERMKRFDSSSKRLQTEMDKSAAECQERFDQISVKVDFVAGKIDETLRKLVDAESQRDGMIKAAKYGIGLGAVLFPALMWLLQHAR